MTQPSFHRILSLVALVLLAVPVWAVSWEGNVTITYNSVTEAYPFRIPDISLPVRGALVNNAHDWAGGQCDWYNNAQMRTLADTYNLVQFEWWGRFNSKAETVAVAEKILLVLKQAAADRAKPEIEFTFVAITGLSGCAEDASWIADAPNLRPRMLAVVCYHDENTPAPDGVPMLGVCAGKEWSSNGPILQLQGHKDLMGGWAKNGQPATVSVEPGQDHPYMADNQSFVAQWLDSLVRLRLPATAPSNNAAAVLPSWKNNRAYIGFFDSSTDAAAPWNGGYRAINLSTQTYASYTGTATWIWLPDQIVANAWMTYMSTGSWVYTPGSGDQVYPAITTQPTNRSVTVGQTATFSVVATGTPTPTYAWRKNGGAISGATSASYTTPATVIGDNDAVFSVVVSNSAGAVTSSNATLTVTTTAVAPAITTQPTNQSVIIGETANFTVAASGSGPLNYQWKFGTSNVGSNSATLSIANAQVANAGTYTCVVTNGAGTVTSNAATLSVNAPPVGPIGTGTGLTGTYFADTTLTNAVVTRTDSTVNFDWGTSSPISGVGVDNFSVRWAGQVQAQFSETYTFSTVSDDGVRMWVNGQQLVDNWTDHAPMENSGTITLVAGQKYDVKIEFFENGGGAVAKLSWSSPSTAKQIAPVTQLYPSIPSALPAGWTAQDIGGVAVGGSTTQSNGTWTVSGSGADIWNNADGCQFASQRITGDVQVTAQVNGLSNTDVWAKAGVMIRESLATGSRHASTFATAANGLAYQRRLTTDGVSRHTAGSNNPAPYWVRIERVGNVVISSTSPNGTTWTEIRRESITMSAAVYVGLAVTSHNNGVLCTATFTNVQLVGVAAAAN